MKNYIHIYWLFPCLFAAQITVAQPNWTVTPSNYQFTMNVTGIGFFDCVETVDENDMVAAFINGECRGVEHFDTNIGGQKMAYLTVYDDVAVGSEVTFKLYDASENTELDVLFSLNFEGNKITGSADNPYHFQTDILLTDLYLDNQIILDYAVAGDIVSSINVQNESGNLQTATIQFVDDAEGIDNPYFTISGANLLLNAALDFENKQSYDIHIEATTSGGCKIDAAFTMTVQNGLFFDIKVFLEGAYDYDSNVMTTSLNTFRGLLPGQMPVSPLAIPTPAGQPYNTEPWNYTGTEGVGWTGVNYSPSVVDWLLVSFRVSIAKDTEIGRTAALLLKDGTVEIPDAFALPPTLTSMYIVIEHRNHVGVMTPQVISVENNTLTHDFTLAESYDGAGTGLGQKLLLSGKWAMFAGDADQTDFPSYDVQGSDKIPWTSGNGNFDTYNPADFNLNGDVNGGDKTLWFENNGVSSRVPR